MPSVSKKQHNFMEAIAHNPSFAKKVGIKQSVGKEFASADKGKTFKQGGDMAESKKMVKKEVAFMQKKGAPKSMVKHEMAEAGMKKGGFTAPTPMGKVRTAAPSRDGVAEKGKTKGKQVVMAGNKRMNKGGRTC
jgi:hypothetical protein